MFSQYLYSNGLVQKKKVIKSGLPSIRKRSTAVGSGRYHYRLHTSLVIFIRQIDLDLVTRVQHLEEAVPLFIS